MKLTLGVIFFILAIAASHTTVFGQTRLRIEIRSDLTFSDGAIVVRADNGRDPTSPQSKVINSPTSDFRIEFERISVDDESPYVFISGEIVDGQQKTVGFIPVHIIDVSKATRPDLVEDTVLAFGSLDEAFQASFPLLPTFKRSLDETSLSAVLHGLKILLVEDRISSDDHWRRVTSDILINLPARLIASSSRTAGDAMRFLDQFVDTANNEKYDRFYVEFLLKIKQAGVGGMPLSADQTLDQFVLATVGRMFTTRIVNTYGWGSNAISVFREQSTERNSADCVSLGITLANAISGAIENELIDIAGDQQAAADVLSLMQKLTECAQSYFLFKSHLNSASRGDVEGAARFLRSDNLGEDLVYQYARLFVILDELGEFPRNPTDSWASRRREIVKYYLAFTSAG